MANDVEKSELLIELNSNVEQVISGVKKQLNDAKKSVESFSLQVANMEKSLLKLNGVNFSNTNNGIVNLASKAKEANAKMKELVSSTEKYVALIKQANSASGVSTPKGETNDIKQMEALKREILKTEQLTLQVEKERLAIKEKQVKIAGMEAYDNARVLEVQQRMKHAEEEINRRAANAAQKLEKQTATIAVNETKKAEKAKVVETNKSEKEMTAARRKALANERLALGEARLAHQKAEFDKKQATKDTTKTVSDQMAKMKSASNSLMDLRSLLNISIAGFAVKEIYNMGKSFLQAAGDAKEAQNLFEVVFSNNTQEALKMQKVISETYGLSTRTYAQSVGELGAMMQQLGVTSELSLGKANDAFKAALDISSAFNMSIDEALRKVTSGVAGQTRPLLSIGVDISIGAMKNYAKSMGYVWRDLDRGTQSLMRLYKIQESIRMSGVEGDFKRTEDSYMNLLRRVSHAFENVRADIGESLIPIAEDLLHYLLSQKEEITAIAVKISEIVSSLMRFFIQHNDAILALGGLSLGLGAIAKIFSDIGVIVTGFKAIGPLITKLATAVTSLGTVGGTMLGGGAVAGGGIAAMVGSNPVGWALGLAAGATILTKTIWDHYKKGIEDGEKEVYNGFTREQANELDNKNEVYVDYQIAMMQLDKSNMEDRKKALEALRNVDTDSDEFRAMYDEWFEKNKLTELAYQAMIKAAQKREEALANVDDNLAEAYDMINFSARIFGDNEIDIAKDKLNALKKEIEGLMQAGVPEFDEMGRPTKVRELGVEYRQKSKEYDDMKEQEKKDKDAKRDAERKVEQAKRDAEKKAEEARKYQRELAVNASLSIAYKERGMLEESIALQLQSLNTQKDHEIKLMRESGIVTNEAISKIEGYSAAIKKLTSEQEILNAGKTLNEKTSENQRMANVYHILGKNTKVAEMQLSTLNEEMSVLELKIKKGAISSEDGAEQMDKLQRAIDNASKSTETFIDKMGNLGSLISKIGDALGIESVSKLGGKFSEWSGLFKDLGSVIGKDGFLPGLFGEDGSFKASSITDVFESFKSFDFGKFMEGNFASSLGNVVGSVISDAFGFSGSKGGAIGSQLGSIVGSFFGPIGGMVGNVLGGALGNAIGGGGRNRGKNEEKRRKAMEVMEQNTSMLNQLTETIKGLTDSFETMANSLIANIAKIPTLSNIAGGVGVLDKLESIYRKDYELGKLSISGEKKKKSFWKGTKRYYETNEFTMEQIAGALGWDLGGKKVTELSTENLKKIRDYLPTLNNDQLKQIWNYAGKDGSYKINGNNLADFSNNLSAYIESLEQLEKDKENFAKETWLSSFEGIAVQDAENVRKEYEDLFKSIGLDPDKYKDEIQEMVDANKVLITITQDVRSGFIDAFADGATASDAFVGSLGKVVDALKKNLASVIYGTQFDKLNEKLEQSFKKYTESMAEGAIPDITEFAKEFAEIVNLALGQTNDINEYIDELKQALKDMNIDQSIIDMIFGKDALDDLTQAVKDALKNGLNDALKNNDISLAAKSIGDAIRDQVKTSLIDAFLESFMAKGMFDKYLKDIDFDNMTFEEAFDAMQDALDKLDKELALDGMGNATTGGKPSNEDINSSVEYETKGAQITNNYKQFIIRADESYISVESLTQLAEKLESMGFEREDKDAI
ncbi:MAG: hypothetical protein ACRCX2_29625 [Paraclostridium sp.]